MYFLARVSNSSSIFLLPTFIKYWRYVHRNWLFFNYFLWFFPILVLIFKIFFRFFHHFSNFSLDFFWFISIFSTLLFQHFLSFEKLLNIVNFTFFTIQSYYFYASTRLTFKSSLDISFLIEAQLKLLSNNCCVSVSKKKLWIPSNLGQIFINIRPLK